MTTQRDRVILLSSSRSRGSSPTAYPKARERWTSPPNRPATSPREQGGVLVSEMGTYTEVLSLSFLPTETNGQTKQLPEAGNNINLLEHTAPQRRQADPKTPWHPARQEGWCAPTLRRKAHAICMRKLFFHCNIWIYNTNSSKSVNVI